MKRSRAIAVETQLTVGSATGIGAYSLGLLHALRAQRVEAYPVQADWLDPWRFDRRILWDQVLLPLAARASGILHCPGGTMPLLTPTPIVVTVHDLAWLRVQGHAPAYARAYFGALMLKRYPHARRIIVSSRFSRDELLATCPQLDSARVTLIYPGVDADFASLQRRRQDARPVILAVGTIEVRKNVACVIEALAMMRHREARLVLIGPPTPYLALCRERAERLGVADRVIFSGYVDRTTLLTAYAQASVAVVPSRYEGFGYGVAQALFAGLPLVVSSAPPLPEIAGPGVTTCDPDSPAAWAAALDALLDDPEAADADARTRREASIDRFGWERAARSCAALYNAVLSE